VIVVDISEWISKLRGQSTEAVSKLDSVRASEKIALGDIILLEILQGARDERDAALIERRLKAFEIIQMVDVEIVRRSAANFRLLRSKGLRLRATVDLVIGTFCIEHGYFLLHQDRDFDIMERHLGLRVL
jgi:predicted nucleic acid-binding protein